MIRTEEEHLAHYGILRRSGRYPWGSGGTESKRNRSYLDTIKMHKSDGMTESEIARLYGITTTQMRATTSIASDQQRFEKILTAERHKEDGWSNVEIGKRMGLAESSVRALLAPGAKERASALQTTANMLKDQVAEKKYIDVGSGVHNQLGVTQTHLKTSVAITQEQGYEVHNIKIQQIGTGKYTTMKVLAPPGTTLGEVQKNRAQIQQIKTRSDDYGKSFDNGIQKPISVNSRRIQINYAEDGGAKADGVIYVRPGVKDLSIGSNNYGQVRISVDGTHYLKGMAVYKEDLPVGKDLVFNTNKGSHVPLKSKNPKADAILKKQSDDPDFPFGSIVRQVTTNGKVTSAMNLVNEEGDWDRWSKTLSSQVLSKQSPDLAKQQLAVTSERRLKEFDEIKSLTNATVRKELLIKFADATDSASVHLKAASLPRQENKVILPIASIKRDEIYAPTMRDGDRVALIRFPHGGTFEIPELTVNNRNREAKKILGTSAQDAVGIHHTVAEHLSGADFDGDTVLVIPNNRKSIKATPALEGLKGFNPQQYKIPKGSSIPVIKPARKQQEMGKVSNLITDMTIHGASTDELARAVRHSMVVIDSEKHGLDFKQSEKDNAIAALKEKYQGGKTKGASTLISRAGSQVHLPEKTPRRASKGGPIDPLTGKKVFEPTGRQRIDRKTGLPTTVLTESVRLAETHDAFTLSSGTQMETIYAEHSNKLKALANTARKEAVATKHAPYSSSAKAVYSNEVASLNSKLNLALQNAPLERQAQLYARTLVGQKQQANPGMEPDELKKIKQQALNTGRLRNGAKKTKIDITQEEWNAIQAGAISTSKLEQILTNTDADSVKRLAMPKTALKMTSTKKTRARSMLKAGYTQAEVADALGVGLTTLKVSLDE